MEKKLGMVAVALLLVSLVGATVFAAGFNGMKGESKNPELAAAIAANDYDAYTQAAEAEMASRMMTEDEFNAFAIHYNEEAPIRTAMASAQTAVQDDDYEAWETAMTTIIESQKAQINRENFDKMVAMHEQMQNVTRTMSMHPKFGRMQMGHAWR